MEYTHALALAEDARNALALSVPTIHPTALARRGSPYGPSLPPS